jgi:hypothetical protein
LKATVVYFNVIPYIHNGYFKTFNGNLSIAEILLRQFRCEFDHKRYLVKKSTSNGMAERFENRIPNAFHQFKPNGNIRSPARKHAKQKSHIFLEITPCSPLKVNHYMPENRTLHNHRCESLNCCKRCYGFRTCSRNGPRT